MSKLLSTKYILYHFSLWYEESVGDIHANDLSILKTLKLIFLLSTINTDKENENLLDHGFTFAAMPYGPVEKEIYGMYQASTISNLIGRDGLNFEEIRNENFNLLSENLKKVIDDNISILKSHNYYLISKSAAYLVDLTHLYNSWENNYKKALKENKFSMDIPNEDIKRDILYYSL